MHNNNSIYLRLRVIKQTDMSNLTCRARARESYVSFRTTYFYLMCAHQRSVRFSLLRREILCIIIFITHFGKRCENKPFVCTLYFSFIFTLQSLHFVDHQLFMKITKRVKIVFDPSIFIRERINSL